MNEEQIKEIEHLEINFTTMVKNGYTRAINRKDSSLLARVYKEVKGEEINIYCYDCVKQALKAIGELYFEYKQKLEEDAHANRNESPDREGDRLDNIGADKGDSAKKRTKRVRNKPECSE